MCNLKIMGVVITLIFAVIFVNSCVYEENENIVILEEDSSSDLPIWENSNFEELILSFFSNDKSKNKELISFAKLDAIHTIILRNDYVIINDKKINCNSLIYTDIFEDLNNFHKLKKLIIDFNKTYDIKELEILDCKNSLNYLEINNADIQNISNISKYCNLETLKIKNCNFEKDKIYDLASEKNSIKKLEIKISEDGNLSTTRIDFDKFKYLENLVILSLHNNFSNLSNFQNLKYLALSSCDIDSKSGFQNLDNLDTLNLNFVTILSSKELENIQSLKSVYYGFSGENHAVNLDFKFLRNNLYLENLKIENFSKKIKLPILDLSDISYLPSIACFQACNISMKNLDFLVFTLDHLAYADINNSVFMDEPSYPNYFSEKQDEKYKYTDYKIDTFIDNKDKGKSINKDSSFTHWKDKNFERFVRKLINKENGDILYSDLDNISKINIPKQNIGESIVSMEDIDNFNNLTHIKIESNSISKIYPYKYADKITSLELSDNIIWDISEIKNYKNLKLLDISNNHMTCTDTSYINSLKNLKEINLDYIGTTDFTNLKDCNSLEKISAFATIVKNIDKIKGIVTLKSLNLSECIFSEKEYHNLDKLNNINCLHIKNLHTRKDRDDTVYKYYSDLNILANLNNLKELHVSGESYNVDGLINLEKLYTIFQYFENQDLSKMKNLKYLYLDNPTFNNKSPLKDCISLEKLIVINPDELINLDQFKNLKNLKELKIVYFHDYDISALSNLQNLEKLELLGYEGNDLSVLHSLKNLKEVIINEEKIEN